MIYIAVAMSVEAKPIIKYFNLKRDNNITKFQVFKNEEIVLIITGVGIVESAISLTYVLNNVEIKESDIFINLGVCGSKSTLFSIGDIILCNKIKNNGNGKCYYPDMVFKHNFKEGSLESFFRVVGKDDEVEGGLVDMEGAGVLEACSHFFKTYQINVIKIVSDFLEEKKFEKEFIENLIERNLEKIFTWVEKRKSFSTENILEFSQEEEEILKKIISNLKLTETMKFEFLEIAKYLKLNGKDFISIFQKYLNIEIKNKNEVKKYFDEIRRQAIEF